MKVVTIFYKENNCFFFNRISPLSSWGDCNWGEGWAGIFDADYARWWLLFFLLCPLKLLLLRNVDNHPWICVYVCVLHGRICPHRPGRGRWSWHQEEHRPQGSPLRRPPVHPDHHLHDHQVLLLLVCGEEELERLAPHPRHQQPDPTGELADEPERHGLLEASLFQTYQQVVDPEKLQGSRQLSFGDLPQEWFHSAAKWRRSNSTKQVLWTS